MFKANSKDTGMTDLDIFMVFMNVLIIELKSYFRRVFDPTLLTNEIYYTIPFAITLNKVKTIEFE